MPDKPTYSITSVDNALRLIELLQQHGTVRVTDAAGDIGVAVSTAHRMLAMLCYRGFAARGGEHLYRAGSALVGTSIDHPRAQDVLTTLRPYLERLNVRTGETVHLIVRHGATVRFIDSIEGTKPLHIGSRIGAVMPAHRISGGQALLAELSPSELSVLYPDGAPAEIAATMTEFQLKLRAVRHRGYGIVDGVNERGVTAIGTVVRAAAREPVAAICISVPPLRLTKVKVPSLARELLQTRLDIDTSPT